MELPKMSDTQKKILKSSVIALVIILLLIGLGLVFSKQKNDILSGILDSRNKTSAPATTATGNTETTDTSTDPTTTSTSGKPTKSKGVFAFLRGFFSGGTADSVSGNDSQNSAILDPLQKDLQAYKDGIAKGAAAGNGSQLNKYGLASDDPNYIKQLQEAHDKYSSLQDQLHTATVQLQQSQEQLAGYQSTAGSGNQTGTLFTATTNAIGQQLTQYQGQVLDMQVQTTFAAVEMAYYFCQGITPGANVGTLQPISLDDIVAGNFQLFSDDGTFNYQVCGSLLDWIHTLPTWLQAQGPTLQLTNYLPYLQQIIQSATFFYCPSLGQQQVPNSTQITLGTILNQMTNYTPPNCPAGQNVGGQYAPGTNDYNNVTLEITSISPDPVLSAAPVTISWYSTGVDQNTCMIIDVTNDPTNFGTGTVIATQKPNIGSFQFTPIQSIGVRTIGVLCSSTQNGMTQPIKDKEDFTLVQSNMTPYVVLSISANALVVGDPAPKLGWISQSMVDNKCTLYKNGTKVAENLSEQESAYQLPIETNIGTFYYQLVCQSDQATMVPSNPVMYTITQPGAITVDLKANNQDMLSFSGASQPVNFTWSSTGTVNSCTSNIGAGQLPPSYSGTGYSKTVTSSQYFTISCSGAGNQKATDMVLIQKLPPGPVLPITVDLKINNQDGITQSTSPLNGIFTWTSTGPVASCSSNFATGNLPASHLGTTYTKAIDKASYFTISCTGNDKQQATDTVLVNMNNVYASQIQYTSAPTVYNQLPAYTQTDPQYQQEIFYTKINPWVGMPPWIDLLDGLLFNLKKVLVGMIVYTQLYVTPIIKNFPAPDWQGRADLNVTVDPQKSFVEEGDMFITGRVSAQKYAVSNLRMEVRYGILPGITTKLQAQQISGNVATPLFKKAFPQSQQVEFYVTDSKTGKVTTSNSISIPAKTSVGFGAHIHNLDKDKPYFFDVIDSNTLVPVLRALNNY